MRNKSTVSKATPLVNRVLSVILCLALLCVFPCAFPANAAETYDLEYPIIYVIGRQKVYRDVGTENEKELADAGTDEVLDAVKECLPYAAKALLLGGKYWDEYSEKTLPVLLQFFDGYGCDENGEPDPSTGIKTGDWSEESLPRDYVAQGVGYSFFHDPRISPFEAADQLNDYIEAVKRVTGKEKVCIIARCMGTNTMLAYLQKYQEPIDYAGVASVLFYTGTSEDIPMLDAAMSGTIRIDKKAAGYFLQSLELAEKVDNETISEVIPYMLDILQNGYGITVTADLIQYFYDHIKDTLIRDFLRETIASTPGYWGMIGEHYEEAKAYIYGEDAETYAGRIAKTDAYYENVYLRRYEILADMRGCGVKVSAVCKYGFPSYPIYENANKISDGDTPVSHQSFGAVTSDYDTRLSDAYVEERTNAGFGDFISPDRQIDASTGFMPDTTWYIKDFPHDVFYLEVHDLLKNIVWRSDFTVRTDAAYPQFLVLNRDTKRPVPQTEDNCDTAMVNPPKETQSGIAAFFARITKLFRSWIALLRTLFGALIG